MALRGVADDGDDLAGQRRIGEHDALPLRVRGAHAGAGVDRVQEEEQRVAADVAEGADDLALFRSFWTTSPNAR